jgi:hypothetical protein
VLKSVRKMSLAKHKKTAAANESMLEFRHPSLEVARDDVERQIAMMDQLLDESYEWEKKFLEMKKKYEDETFLRTKLLDLDNPKKVAQHLNSLCAKLTGKSTRMYGEDVEGWAMTKTLISDHHYCEQKNIPEVWEIFREIKLICERVPEFTGHHRTESYRNTPDDETINTTQTRPFPIGDLVYSNQPYRDDIVKQTKEEYVKDVDQYICMKIRGVVRRAHERRMRKKVAQQIRKSPEYRNAQMLCAAKNIGLYGNPKNDKSQYRVKSYTKPELRKWAIRAGVESSLMPRSMKVKELRVTIQDELRLMSSVGGLGHLPLKETLY